MKIKVGKGNLMASCDHIEFISDILSMSLFIYYTMKFIVCFNHNANALQVVLVCFAYIAGKFRALVIKN